MFGCTPTGKVPPEKKRGKTVRRLRKVLEDWSNECDKIHSSDVELSTTVQACARLEQSCIREEDHAKEEKKEQVASLLMAAESIIACEELRAFMTERNRAAIDASILLFGEKGKLQASPTSGVVVHPEGKPLAVGGWQPRWQGDPGDPFEPYQQLMEQYLHGAISYHSRVLEQLSTAFASIRTASKKARDAAYLRTLAAAAGVTVKEYQRLLDVFNKIDAGKSGAISKSSLMDAMKKDKDIAAFMQLSRQKTKDGRRESFDAVFNRIDAEGVGQITWESFLKFFSDQRSLAAD